MSALQDVGTGALLGTGIGALSGSAGRGAAIGALSGLAYNYIKNDRRSRFSGGAKKRRSRKSKKWVSKATSSLKKPGSLTRQAKAARMTTKAFAHRVLRNPSHYSLTTRRRAQFFVNINRRN